MRSLEQNNGKTQDQSDSDTRNILGVGYQDNLVKGIREVDQVQRKEDTRQRKIDSTDSQTGLFTAGIWSSPKKRALKNN